jgi:hypothetical protein
MVFEEHMMYKGEESEKAETKQEHLKLKKMGWGHKKGPFKMKYSPISKRGLWDNIHAKRKRIKGGSGETMRKPGSKGAPSAKDLKDSQ